ncbi:MAG TPA: oligosaccharide flippase family protein [Elusimicrobiota bacterium]|nr:oligosaccharide flippase family protein [Elusimicrobiota bacterium]
MAEKSFRFVRNFSWSLFGQTGAAALSFLIIPFVVHRLGVKAYGIYILMNSAASYLQLCALGVGGTTVKFVASLTATGSRRALKRLLSYSLAAHGLGVLAGAAFLVLGVRFVAARVLHVPADLLELADFVLVCAAFGALFLSLTQFSVCILQGLQRFESSSLIDFLQKSLMPLGTAGLLISGHGLKSMALLYVAVNVVLCLLAAALAYRFLPLHGDDGPDDLAFKTFASWSLSSWLGPFAWIISNQVDKVFLVRMMSLTAVTLYAVPAGLLQRLQALPTAVSTVVWPMMSELRGPDADESMRRMYLKALRFLLWLTLPGLIGLVVFMPQFLGLWLHGDFAARSVWPARLLVISQVFFLFTVMPNAAVYSRDKPSHATAYAWGQALTCLAAWRLLAPRYGLMGIAEGSLLGQALPALVFLAHVHRMIHLGFRRFVAGVWAPAVSGFLLLAALAPFHAEATSWLRLALFAAAGGLLFYASTWVLMDADDRRLLHRFMRSPLAALRPAAAPATALPPAR